MKMMISKTKNTNGGGCWLTTVEDRLKMIQVKHLLFKNHNTFIIQKYITESDRSKLDPLPEEKISSNSPDYKRVYKDWKPSSTLQKTDIAGTIEAIEGEILAIFFLTQTLIKNISQKSKHQKKDLQKDRRGDRGLQISVTHLVQWKALKANTQK